MARTCAGPHGGRATDRQDKSDKRENNNQNKRKRKKHKKKNKNKEDRKTTCIIKILGRFLGVVLKSKIQPERSTHSPKGGLDSSFNLA